MTNNDEQINDKRRQVLSKLPITAAGIAGLGISSAFADPTLLAMDNSGFDPSTNSASNIIDVKRDFGAVGDRVTDDTGAIQAAINAAGKFSDNPNQRASVVYFPPGYYLVTNEISLTGKSGITLQGAGPDYSRLVMDGSSARSMLNLTGAIHISVRDFALQSLIDNGGNDFAPDCVLMLGRTSTASAGFHRFYNVRITGAARKALIYSIASEANSFIAVTAVLSGGGALYAFYIAQTDYLGVGGFVGSTNLSQYISHSYIANQTGENATQNSAALYIRGGGSTGNITMRDSLLFGAGGSVITLASNAEDQLFGPLVFDSLRAEPDPDNRPLYGFHIEPMNGPAGVSRLSITNCDFTHPEKYFIYGGDGSKISGGTLMNNQCLKPTSLYHGDSLFIAEYSDDIEFRGVLAASMAFVPRVRDITSLGRGGDSSLLFTNGKFRLGSTDNINEPDSYLTGYKSSVYEWQPPELPRRKNVTVSEDFSRPGIEPGDTVLASFTQELPSGIILSASVPKTDTVRVTLLKTTKGKLILPAGQLRVDLWNHN